MNFKELEVIPRIIDALEDQGYEEPTAIQKQAIPVILEGHDVLASAQTGTGKTAAFAIPTIQMLNDSVTAGHNKQVKALILSPTRELAQQIFESFTDYAKYTKVKSTVIFGGVSQKTQVNRLKKGVDIVIATPGRLMDLMNQGLIDISHVEMFVLDEADRMLDMGFIHDIKRIGESLPKDRQTLLFSATIPKEVKKIADSLMNEPVSIATERVSSAAESIDQKLYFVDPDNKKHLLLDLVTGEYNGSVLVFTRTKRNADQVARFLNDNKVKAMSIHGDKTQGARKRALKSFKEYKIQVLVATDVAARGIDIERLSCVVNFNIPDESETYIHRIGRTGRAGETGESVSFCDYGERGLLKDIEKLMGTQIEVIEDHEYPMEDKTVKPPNAGRRRGGGGGRGGRNSRGGKKGGKGGRGGSRGRNQKGGKKGSGKPKSGGSRKGNKKKPAAQ